MMRYLLGLLTFSVVFLFIGGCESDVDLLAPYKSTPVIFGVLDYTADSQFVRINRTYLGSGNAEVYAQIKDSVEYNPSEVDAWLIKIDGGDRIDSIQLQYIERPSRDPGVFYNQNVGFYYTDEDLFTANEITQIQQGSLDLLYRIEVVARGKFYSAETNFPALRASNITFPPFTGQGPIDVEFWRPSTSSFQAVSFLYNANSYTARYQGVLRINYDYNTTDGALVTDQHIDFQLGTRDNTLTNNPSASFGFNARNWYEFVGDIFKEIPNLKKVRIENLEFRLSAGNDVLNTYINVAQPISDFTPVITSYSNFSGGAIGILGSRAEVAREFYLTDPSIEQLNSSDLTTAAGDPCYCAQDWVGTVWVCTATQNNCP